MRQTEDRFEAAKQSFLAGLAQMELHNLPEAQTQFEQSLALMPGRTSTLVNLGAVRLGLNRPDQALPVLDQACRFEPGNTQAWAYKGQALKALQRPAEAAQSLTQAAQLQPGNPWLWTMLSEAQIAAEQAEAALTSLNRLLVLTPDNATAWSNRGMLLRDLQRPQEAADSFVKAIAILSAGGRNSAAPTGALALNQFYLAAVQAAMPGHSANNKVEATDPARQAAPASAPRAYVEKLFDQYAADFDAQLVQGLHYHAPAILLIGLHQRQPDLRWGAVLDLGCGSGLCGPLFRPFAQKLHGLDVSSDMLQKARDLAVYDQLWHADALEHLHNSTPSYNLILAADVLIYIGELDGLFAAVVRSLQPGGQFAFTVELLESLGAQAVSDVSLLPSLRYAHSEAYVRRLAVQFGFEVEQLDHQTLRYENTQPVAGLFVYLKLSS